jgi:predicted patatin/cPLA2 family phospholipase
LINQFDTLILEGGSLKCAFTAGVLDVLLDNNFTEFQNFYGVSSGSMAMSYFISRQRKNFIKVSRALVENPDFLSYMNSFSSSGVMNLDFLEEYVRETFPFDEDTALKNIEGKLVKIIATDKLTGNPHYITPTKDNWINVLMASATLPFITKGETIVEGVKLFDGGYSDPIPVREAIKNGAKKMLIIRTRPSEERLDQSYVSWFAGYWNYDNDSISELFQNSYKTYNDRAEFLSGQKPEGIDWHMIAPPHPLKSDGYYLYKEDIDADYRLGLEYGLDFIQQLKQS